VEFVGTGPTACPKALKSSPTKELHQMVEMDDTIFTKLAVESTRSVLSRALRILIMY